MILAPGVGRGEGVAFFVGGFGPGQDRLAHGPRHREDDLLERLPGKRLGLPGGGTEARRARAAGGPGRG